MYTCTCGFTTKFNPLFINHTTRKCGDDRMFKICEAERMGAFPIDEFIINLIENDEELHHSHKIINFLHQNNKNSIPYFIQPKISFVKGYNNLFKKDKKKGDHHIDYKWSHVNTTDFLEKYIEYYNQNSQKKIKIDNINDYINLLIKQQ